MRLRALRGAITVPTNDADAILEATEELVRTVMERNALSTDEMVSCIFTATDDLDAEFPAVAARRAAAAGALLERVVGVASAQLPGRHECCEQSRGQRHGGGERQHPPVDGYLLCIVT